jgi:SAM-dependent methyltransferase
MDLVEAAAASEHRHPWELSRLDGLLTVLHDHGPWRDIADVGAGDCFVASALRREATGDVYAVDLHYADAGVSGGVRRERSIAALPDRGLDCIVMMDVLEHVQDETTLLAESRRALRPGGLLLVTVPAFQSLYSAHDVYLKHFRRYRRRQLLAVLERGGFVPSESFYFYASLVPARLAQVVGERVLGPRAQDGVGQWRYGDDHPATRGVRQMLDWDFRACRALGRRGFLVPGLSVCAVCRNASV